MPSMAEQGSNRLLNEVESKRLLEQAGINVVESHLAISHKEAVSISKELGFPVVLKVASSDIVHKSDSGGVKLALNSVNQVENAYKDIMN